ncbi:MAG: hypothetical protein PHD04_00860 [Candidatus Pacebacteria bacterium]|nr:hypothetical protein [Candidatus Paceibacterota bacterium]
MAYSNVGIANMALQRIGARSSITTFNDGSPNAIRVNAVWEYIRDEVIEAIKPKFATVRVALAQSAVSPANTDVWDYAYPLPSDYLCLADDNKDDNAVWPDDVAPYVIETLSDGTLCLMTNYDSTTADYQIYLTYIRKVADPAKYTPSFINAFVFRLGAELSFSVPESGGKFEAMMTLYERAKKRAMGFSRAQDYLEDENGSTSWENAR